MKKIVFILILISLLSAQEKYLIYFSDKGISKEEFSSQKTNLLKAGKVTLSERAIERRKKVLGEDYFFYKDLVVNESYIKEIVSLGVQIQNQLKWFNAVSAFLTDEQIEQILLLDFVDKIEKVRTIKFRDVSWSEKSKLTSAVTSDYIYDYGNSLAQDELHDIPIAHSAGLNGQGVVIGFLDSGFNWEEHPALANLNVLYEYDYIQDDEISKDEPGDSPGQDNHGTAVFSIGAGFAEGQLIGPAFGASFLLAKTDDIGSERRTDEDNFVAAVEDFEQMGADIITASLGYSIFDTEEETYDYADMNGNTTLSAKAYNYAFDLGVITVNAAGNEGNNNWRHIISPADAFNVIAVGNITVEGVLNSSSSRGPTTDGRIKPEVVAMGTNNYHAVSGGYYSSLGVGTSFSAPMVAGMIGQLLSAYPYLTNVQVRNIVLHSGDNYSSPNNNIGYGIMSIKRALNYPNVWEYETNKFIINKMFLGKDITIGSDIKVYYKINEDQWGKEQYSFERDSVQYSFNLPADAHESDKVKFYYTFNNSDGVLVREPVDNNYEVSLSNSVVSFSTGVVEFPDELVNDYRLYQNYPNPFNPRTAIEFESPRDEFARVTIFNMLGQKVRDLYTGIIIKGLTRFYWDGRNNSNQKLASGAYIYSININGNNFSKKMILLK